MAGTGSEADTDTATPRRGSLPTPLPRVGDTVTIYRLALARPPLIEGRAMLLDGLDPARDLCRVRFLGEAVPRARLVHPGPWQAEPDAMLRALLAHWRMSRLPEALAGFLADDTFPLPGERSRGT